MKNFNWKRLVPHVIAIAIFAVVALVYCKPALEGKVLQQHDVTQWKGMAQDLENYKAKHNNTLPLWTNGMFSGMPSYQIAVRSDNPIAVNTIEKILTLNLPRPVSFFFLACLCFYFLAQVWRINPYLGIIGALAYAYATYNPIIIGAGHDTKMQAIAYMPSVIAAVSLVFQRKYLWGAALTAITTALLIGANHLQITYYTFIIIAFMTIGFAVQWIKEKNIKHLVTSLGVVAVTVIIGVAVNLVMLATTYEYASRSIRGGSALADGKSGTSKTGLTEDYALSYSLYKTEPLVLMFPKIYGGSSGRLEVEEDKSKAIQALREMPQELGNQLQNYLQFYWGGIDGVGTAGPPYAGAIICFLALIGFAILDNKHKWWILAAIVLTTLMSWGQYLRGFNVFLLNTLPFYNKFRAPSMIMVVPTLLLCLMAMLTVQKIITTENKEELWNKYKKGLIVAASIFALAFLVYFSSDFTSNADKSLLKQISEIPDAQQKTQIDQQARSFINGLREDRKSLFMGDIFRSLLFILPVAGLIWLSIRKRITGTVLLAVTGVLAFIDVIIIDNQYLNSERYEDKEEYETTFRASPTDEAILKDKGYYRVLDVSRGITGAFNSGALTSYFHKSIGGYHPAKLSIYQDLIEKQLYNYPNCVPVINMLNTKYVIAANQQGQTFVMPNPEALGACWFVNAVAFKNGPAEVMNALTNFSPKDTAVVDVADKALVKYSTTADSAATIELVNNDNDFVEYKVNNSSADRFAVFSEVFYDAGWKAYIDGKETPIVKTNYVLRGLSVPAGSHKITFEFKPASFYSSTKIAIASSAIAWLLLLAAIGFAVKNRDKAKA